MTKVADVDDASLLKMYLGLRDRRARRKAAYNADDDSDKNKQDKIEIEFLRRFNDRGIDNVSTRGIGTAYRTVRTSASVGDRDEFFGFVEAEGAWELLEVRASKKAVEQYKEHHGDLPPGVNWSEMQTVGFQTRH